jgi:hypothetical protein
MRDYIWSAMRVSGIVENRVAKKGDVVAPIRHCVRHAHLRAAQPGASCPVGTPRVYVAKESGLSCQNGSRCNLPPFERITASEVGA